MTILEYLQRLNLDQYASKFASKNLYFVTDLRHFQDENQLLDQLDLQDDAKRFISMMFGDSKTKEDFNFVSKNQARQAIRKFINNNTVVEKLVEFVDVDVITGHILNDILCTNTTVESIQAALEKRARELKESDLSTANSILLK